MPVGVTFPGAGSSCVMQSRKPTGTWPRPGPRSRRSSKAWLSLTPTNDWLAIWQGAGTNYWLIALPEEQVRRLVHEALGRLVIPAYLGVSIEMAGRSLVRAAGGGEVILIQDGRYHADALGARSQHVVQVAQIDPPDGEPRNADIRRRPTHIRQGDGFGGGLGASRVHRTDPQVVRARGDGRVAVFVSHEVLGRNLPSPLAARAVEDFARGAGEALAPKGNRGERWGIGFRGTGNLTGGRARICGRPSGGCLVGFADFTGGVACGRCFRIRCEGYAVSGGNFLRVLALNAVNLLARLMADKGSTA
jgi:hypothetical protein